jgi:proteasome lid subunit RPN8/RPN11
MALRCPETALEAVLRHGEQSYPYECCGLLLGTFQDGCRQVTAIEPLRNANTESPRTRYDLDPREHLAAQRSARARGLEIIGFYHSHPDHPAQPSQYDLDHAAWPGYSYLIVSIARGRRAPAGAAHSFELAEDRSRFLPESLEPIP